MKEMFIKDTDVKVEVGQIIVKDGEAYTVKPSNIPELFKKGILEFKDINMTKPKPEPKNYIEEIAKAAESKPWEDLIIDEYEMTDAYHDLQDLFSDFPGVWTSLILKRISNAFQCARPFRFNPYDGYYFINSTVGDIVYCPKEKISKDIDFGMFAYFATQEEAEYAQSQVYEQ